VSIAPISSLLNIWPLTNLSAPILAITLATSVGDTPALDKAVTKSICSSVKSVIDAPCGLTVARGSCTVGCMLVRPPLATAADEVDGDGAGGFKLGGVFAKTKGISRLVDVGSCSKWISSLTELCGRWGQEVLSGNSIRPQSLSRG